MNLGLVSRNPAGITTSDSGGKVTVLSETTRQHVGAVGLLLLTRGISSFSICRTPSLRSTRYLYFCRKSIPIIHSSYISATQISCAAVKLPIDNSNWPFALIGVVSPVTVRMWPANGSNLVPLLSSTSGRTMVMSLPVSIVRVQSTPAIEPKAERPKEESFLHTLIGATRVSLARLCPASPANCRFPTVQ